MRKAIVIGAGLGGLSSAIRLAMDGWKVDLFERGDTPGGKMNTWQEAGYRFDTGPSLITMPWVFEELFTAADTTLSDHLDLISMLPLASYHYPDGTSFNYTSSMPEWLNTLSRTAPEDEAGFFQFMALGSRIFELSQDTFFKASPYSPPDVSGLKALKNMPLRRVWGNYNRLVCSLFKSPYLRQMFNRYPTYVGSSPYQTPATLAIIPYIEYAFGGWYINGGLHRLVETLAGLAVERGVEMHYNTPVEAITHQGNRVTGILTGSQGRQPADIVVMNGDASFTPGLLGMKNKPSLKRGDRSMSGFVMLLGLKNSKPDWQHHMIYFSDDYQREFAQLFHEYRFPDDPTVYVNTASRSDRSAVPGDGETVFIMANAPAADEPWNEDRIQAAEGAVLNRLRKSGFPDMDGDVVVKDIWTPERIGERYQMPGGAIYGTHSHGWKRAFLRPPNKDKTIMGLYYVGGSTHPGGGTPTVIMSSQITHSLIKKYEKN